MNNIINLGEVRMKRAREDMAYRIAKMTNNTAIFEEMGMIEPDVSKDIRELLCLEWSVTADYIYIDA